MIIAGNFTREIIYLYIYNLFLPSRNQNIRIYKLQNIKYNKIFIIMTRKN